ncbi:MAG: hypothetical protein JW782_02565 [Candidatus Saganbacteria bacterium]|nr:hypothetical protein [Candidatus Saganbacteria bacterium]
MIHTTRAINTTGFVASIARILPRDHLRINSRNVRQLYNSAERSGNSYKFLYHYGRQEFVVLGIDLDHKFSASRLLGQASGNLVGGGYLEVRRITENEIEIFVSAISGGWGGIDQARLADVVQHLARVLGNNNPDLNIEIEQAIMPGCMLIVITS